MRPPCCSLSPSTRNTSSSQTRNTNNDDCVEARSNYGFILLYDDDVVEDRDFSIPIMREMDDDYLIKSDNIDTQSLYLNGNLCVVSTICPPDRTVTQLLQSNLQSPRHLSLLMAAITRITIKRAPDAQLDDLPRRSTARRFLSTPSPTRC